MKTNRERKACTTDERMKRARVRKYRFVFMGPGQNCVKKYAGPLEGNCPSKGYHRDWKSFRLNTQFVQAL